eukprot:m.164915 g.164915  ORF g.164915 m.164915 type:complete len:770 (-) comp12490_c0_seq1:324-2633(-)
MSAAGGDALVDVAIPSNCAMGLQTAADTDTAPPTGPQLAFRRRSVHARRGARHESPAPGVDAVEVYAHGLPQPDVPMEPLPPIRSVQAGPARDALVVRKIKQCEHIYCFHVDIPAEEQGKELKRNNLIELTEVIGAPAAHGGPTVRPEILHAAIQMIERNILRDLNPPTDPGAPEFDPLEDVYIDPRWPHLQHVYALLSKILESVYIRAPFAKDCITRTFVRRTLELFRSYDKREREALKNFLHRAYARIVDYRSYIRSLLSHMYLRHIYDRPDGQLQGICEMLDISGSIITGFASPIKAEHINFLRKILMPLHGAPDLEHFHSQLAFCVLQFVQKSAQGPANDPENQTQNVIVDVVLNGLFRYWPKTSSAKEVMFMNELEEFLDTMSEAAFFRKQTVIMRRIAQCIGSMHFQVVERALVMLKNDKVIATAFDYADWLFLPALRAQVDVHWCSQVRDRLRHCIGFLDWTDEAAAMESDVNDVNADTDAEAAMVAEAEAEVDAHERGDMNQDVSLLNDNVDILNGDIDVDDDEDEGDPLLSEDGISMAVVRGRVTVVDGASDAVVNGVWGGPRAAGAAASSFALGQGDDKSKDELDDNDGSAASEEGEEGSSSETDHHADTDMDMHANGAVDMDSVEDNGTHDGEHQGTAAGVREVRVGRQGTTPSVEVDGRINLDGGANGDEAVLHDGRSETLVTASSPLAAAGGTDLLPTPASTPISSTGAWQLGGGPKRPRESHGHRLEDGEEDVNDVETVAKWRRLEGSTAGPHEV